MDEGGLKAGRTICSVKIWSGCKWGNKKGRKTLAVFRPYIYL